jgi:hypothetical protein
MHRNISETNRDQGEGEHLILRDNKHHRFYGLQK